MNTDQVKNIQREMNQRGYTGIDGRPLAEDGVLGQNTVHAIRGYAKDHPDSGFAKADALYNANRADLVKRAVAQTPSQTTGPFTNNWNSVSQDKAIKGVSDGGEFKNRADKVNDTFVKIMSTLAVLAPLPGPAAVGMTRPALGVTPKIAPLASGGGVTSILKNQAGKVSVKTLANIGALAGSGISGYIGHRESNVKDYNAKLAYKTQTELDRIGVRSFGVNEPGMMPLSSELAETTQPVNESNVPQKPISGLTALGISVLPTVAFPAAYKLGEHLLSKGAFKWPAVKAAGLRVSPLAIAAGGYGLNRHFAKRSPLETVEDNPTPFGRLSAVHTKGGGVAIQSGLDITLPIPTDSLNFARPRLANGGFDSTQPYKVNLGGKWYDVDISKLSFKEQDKLKGFGIPSPKPVVPSSWKGNSNGANPARNVIPATTSKKTLI